MDSHLYIAHHGIKGQKWGVKHGPPYPLDDNQKSYSEKRLSNEIKVNSQSKSQDRIPNKSGSVVNGAKQFYSDHEKEIKIGLAVAGTALAVYGAYKLYQNVPMKSYGAFSYATSDPLLETLGRYSDAAPRIPSNVTFHRISREAVADYTDAGSAYVSYLFRDNAKYVSAGNHAGAFPGGSRGFVHTLRPTEQVRVASARQMAELFLEQHPTASDQQFRYIATHGFIEWDSDDLSDDLVLRRSREMASSFRQLLLDRGYNAIVDLEDAGHSSEAPLILLNPSTMATNARRIINPERVVARLVSQRSK